MASVVTVNDIINLLDEMAPPELAESWDNVGLTMTHMSFCKPDG